MAMPFMIRPAERTELRDTVDIYLECLRADYTFKPRAYLDGQSVEENLAECEKWRYDSASPNMIYAAMDGPRMAGYIAVGPNTGDPVGYDGEVGGLFVRQDCRGRGAGLMLLRAGLAYLRGLGCRSVIIYNYRISAANEYYRALGGELVYEMVQSPGGMDLHTDVFAWEIDALLETLARRLRKYEPEGQA
jgi:GNAT superfamily N-acetyltransferase